MKAALRTLLFILGSLFVLLVALEILIYKSNYQGENLMQKPMKSCSWIDMVPKNWDCTDNWDRKIRVIKAGEGEKYLQLTITLYTKKQTVSRPCTPVLPAGLPTRPSPSGIALPMWCFGSGTYQIAEWDQDGFFFQFLGFKVPWNLYLYNLDRIGESKPEHFKDAIITPAETIDIQ